MDIRQTNCPKRHKGALGGGGVRGSNIQKSREAVKRLQLWFTSVDSSGNINTIRPSIPQGAWRGGVGITNSKVLGSCQTAGPIGTKFGTRLWIHLGNGHRLKTIRHTIRRGDILGGFMGSTIHNSGKCGQTAGPIGLLCTCKMQMKLGKDTG